MERTELVSTDYLVEARLHDRDYVAELFDRLHSDAVEVRDACGVRMGAVYLEDFCNMRELQIEPVYGDNVVGRNNDEDNLLSRVTKLSEAEIGYVRKVVFNKFGSDFVCCCDSERVAKKIVARIFSPTEFNVSYRESVLDLHDGDNVLFLSFNRIKLYRKVFKGKIASMIALNNSVLDSENRTVFYSKYEDLLNMLSSIGVTYFYGIIPEADQLTCLSDGARRRVSGYGTADYDFCADLLGGIESPDYIACMDQNRQSRVIDRGIFRSLMDCRGKFYNVVGGMRMTLGQPSKSVHTAYLFGPCTARGAMVSDGNTVASLLQKRLNESGGGWLVLNCGVGGGSDLENTYRYVLSLPLKSGDAVLFLESGSFLEDATVNGETIFNLSNDFNHNPPSNEWFLDRPAHCNVEANAVIAEAFFRKLSARTTSIDSASDSAALNRFKGQEKVFSDSLELRRYIDGISRLKFGMKTGESAGAILMHCNPMTLGHKYLITEALKDVDYLYVFLLSIDRSEIPYALRREMLLHETRDLGNVRVLDCGEFLGSPRVFPDYFTKDSKHHSRIDATKEVLVFCQYVAPALGITKRFVGTENRDFVTRQYNNQLKLILPMYSIELKELDRVTVDGRDVSAFLTRQLAHEGRWGDVEKQVSRHTLKLLRQHYGKEMANV